MCWFGPRVSSGQRTAPDPPFSILVWRARAFYALIQLIFLQQRGVAVLAYELHIGAEGGEGNKEWAGWIGLASGIGYGKAPSLIGGHGRLDLDIDSLDTGEGERHGVGVFE